MKPFLGIAIVVTLVMGLLWEQRLVSQSARENATLLNAKAEVDKLEASNRDLARLKAELASAQASTDAKLELARLRGEVVWLRVEQKEAARLREASEQLAAQLKSAPPAAPQLADQPGYISRGRWVDSGFGTPEATIQTLFAAMRDMNFDRVINAMVTQARRPYEEKPADERDRMTRTLNKHSSKLDGYRIVDRVQEDVDRLILKIQGRMGSEPLSLTMELEGGEWKVGAPWIILGF